MLRLSPGPEVQALGSSSFELRVLSWPLLLHDKSTFPSLSSRTSAGIYLVGHVSVHSLNKYVLSTYSVPDILLGSGFSAVTKTD